MRDQTEHRPSSSAAGSPNIYAALADLARRAPDGALATAATIGVLAVMGLLFVPWGWGVYLLPLVAVGTFGVWGIADRDRGGAPPVAHDQEPPRAAFPVASVVQWLAAAVGTVATVIAVLTLLGALVGRVIS